MDFVTVTLISIFGGFAQPGTPIAELNPPEEVTSTRQKSPEAIDRMIQKLLHPSPRPGESIPDAVHRIATNLKGQNLSDAHWVVLLDGMLNTTDLPLYSCVWKTSYDSVTHHLNISASYVPAPDWRDRYFGVYADTPDSIPQGHDLPVFTDCQSIFNDEHPYQKRYCSVSVCKPDGTWRELETRAHYAGWRLWSDGFFIVPKEDLTISGDKAEVTLRLDASIGRSFDFSANPISHGPSHKVSRTVTRTVSIARELRSAKKAVTDAEADALLRSMDITMLKPDPGDVSLPLLQLWSLPTAYLSMKDRGIDTLAVTLSLETGGACFWTSDAWYGNARPAWRAGEPTMSLTSNFALTEDVIAKIKDATGPVSLRIKSNPALSLRDFVSKTYWSGEVVVPDIKEAMERYLLQMSGRKAEPASAR